MVRERTAELWAIIRADAVDFLQPAIEALHRAVSARDVHTLRSLVALGKEDIARALREDILRRDLLGLRQHDGVVVRQLWALDARL